MGKQCRLWAAVRTSEKHCTRGNVRGKYYKERNYHLSWMFITITLTGFSPLDPGTRYRKTNYSRTNILHVIVATDESLKQPKPVLIEPNSSLCLRSVAEWQNTPLDRLKQLLRWKLAWLRYHLHSIVKQHRVKLTLKVNTNSKHTHITLIMCGTLMLKMFREKSNL